MKPIEICAPNILLLVKIFKFFVECTEELEAYKRERLYQVILKLKVFILLDGKGMKEFLSILPNKLS